MTACKVGGHGRNLGTQPRTGCLGMDSESARATMEVQLAQVGYYGSQVRSREVAGLLLTEKVHAGGDRTPPHSHEQPFLCVVLDGACQVGFYSGTQTCTPRSVVYHPAGEIHWDQFAPSGGRAFAIEFGPIWRERLARVGTALDEPHVRIGGPVSSAAVRLYDESRRHDDVASMVIEGLMLELLGLLSRAQQGRTVDTAPAWLRNAEDLLHAEFRAPPALSELATRVGVHPVHLSRVFRARHGCTVGDYIRRIRIECASDALVMSERSVAEIAYETGFTDQSHFTKAFRRVTLTTPAKFRAAGVGGSSPDLRSHQRDM
jgi:AraC family transcriptional regulator